MATLNSGENVGLKSKVEPAGKNDQLSTPARKEDVFSDPRGSSDRRQQDDPSQIPGGMCRRRSDRRTMVYIKNECWWIKRNYTKPHG